MIISSIIIIALIQINCTHTFNKYLIVIVLAGTVSYIRKLFSDWNTSFKVSSEYCCYTYEHSIVVYYTCAIQLFYRKEVVRVSATVVEHVRLAKVIVFKKKKRKGYKKKKGMTTYSMAEDIKRTCDFFVCYRSQGRCDNIKN